MRARTARWVAGCIAAGSIALMAGGLALAYVDRHLVPAGLTNWDFSDVFGQVTNMAVPVMGFVLASRRPANRIGWLALAAGLGLGLSRFSTSYGLRALVAAPGSVPAGRAVAWLANWTWVIPLAVIAFVFLLFPTGRLRSRRWRVAGWFVGGALALTAVGALVGATRVWSHPFTAQAPAFVSAILILLPAALAVSVAAVVVRFARSSGEERLQLKWFVAAALLVVATLTASVVTNSVAAAVLDNLAFLCVNAAVAIAVLKYRLYDIDRVISRTVAYAIVTGLLIGIYTGLVLLATQVLGLRTPVAVAAATLAAAALFSPVRRRVQRVVDRRFNRARYDADQTVAAFATRLKDAVNLDSVRDDLAGVVSRALEPAHVSVWISQRD
ncbi:MAG TPA: hypothetical protein VGY32_14010 [Solirubrobacteraceae bacterium]|nr:hypothetical protein [Solirubrobacteraceae bacterium]